MPERKHGFIGTISNVNEAGMGFIHPSDFGRRDGARRGITVDDDIFVHPNAFDYMSTAGYQKPAKIEVGMVIMFTIAPSTNKPGKLTAEQCTVVEKE